MNFFILSCVTSLSIRAKSTGTTVPSTILAMASTSVLRSTSKLSGSIRSVLKFSSPTHSEPVMPLAGT